MAEEGQTQGGNGGVVRERLLWQTKLAEGLGYLRSGRRLRLGPSAASLGTVPAHRR